MVERGKMSELVMIKMNREGVKKEMHMTTFYIMTVTCPSDSPLTREICVREIVCMIMTSVSMTEISWV